MSLPIIQKNKPDINNDYLPSVIFDSIRTADIPISIQGLLALELIKKTKVLLWIASNDEEMQKLNETINTFKDTNQLVFPFAPATQDPAAAGRWRLAASTHPEPPDRQKPAASGQNPDPTQSRQQGLLVARAARAAVPAVQPLRSGAESTTARTAASSGVTQTAQSGGPSGLLGRAHSTDGRSTLAAGQQRPDRGPAQGLARGPATADPRCRPAQSATAPQPDHPHRCTGLGTPAPGPSPGRSTAPGSSRTLEPAAVS